MSKDGTAIALTDRAAESLAAELTAAVYPVALQFGARDDWLDLELALWHVLAETIQRLDRQDAKPVETPTIVRNEERTETFLGRVTPSHA